MVHCRLLLKGLLVLAVLVLGYVLVGVAPVSATVTVLDWAAVRGTDNHVYVASYSSGGWSSWQSLGGSTPSPPGICEEAGYAGNAYVVVRGMDNGIYYKEWSIFSGWSGWSSTSGGVTIDTPACAITPFYDPIIVVRSTNNELYMVQHNVADGWNGWQDLHGTSASAPVLVPMLSLNRIDLVVQGTNNRIYHNSMSTAQGAGFSLSWNSPPCIPSCGKTSSRPAAAFHMIMTCNPNCFEQDEVLVVVRGMDNHLYVINYIVAAPGIPTGGAWGYSWGKLGGATLSAPTLAFYPSGCDSGSTVSCTTEDGIAVRGTNNALYYMRYVNGWMFWQSPGGSISNSPALAGFYSLGIGFVFLVQGTPSCSTGCDSKLYSITYSNELAPPNGPWGKWSSLGGATPSDPALTAVL